MARRLLGRTSVRDALDSAVIALSAAGCDTPRLDAELLLAHALSISRAALITSPSRPLEPDEARLFMDLAARRRSREPVAYILGEKGFRRIVLRVDPRVLVPRPETEFVVEAALSLPAQSRVVDVGTGSGAIALALKEERPDLSVVATDVSADALDVARENAERLGLDLEVSVARGLPESVEAEEVDLVIANMPYVTDETIYDRTPEIQKEPRIAVTGDCGPDGLGVIRSVIDSTPSGWKLAMEHDTHHGPAMRELLRDATTLQDYEGDDRVTVGYRP